jgi:tetratricopeptide (TPR) repeat protein
VPTAITTQLAPMQRWRATLIVGLVVSLAVGAAALGWWYARESPPHQGPIVLISVDGLSGAELSAYGAKPGRTPSLDALAADSVVFERAYTHSPLVLPAHASILTGQLPPAHGVRHDVGFSLPPGARTLAEILGSRGFATGAAVSSLLLRHESGLDQGFRFFDAEFRPSPDGQPSVTRGARDTFDAASRWLRMQSGQRYFLFLQIPRADADAVIGDAIAWLEQRGLYDQATVLLVGSRGDAGNGLVLDEAILRVPLFVKQPGRDGAGTRVAPSVQHADLLPTILDLVRAPMPGGLQGQSLRPALGDPSQARPGRTVFSESLAARYLIGGSPVFALANERHRLVRDDGEAIVPIDPPGPPADGADNPDAAPLRSVLDAILKGRDVAEPEPFASTDRKTGALLGYLDGPASAPAPRARIDAAAQADAVAALRRAARQVGADRLSDAIRTLQSAATARPALALVHFQLGTLLARSGRLDEAAASFRRAASAAPTSAEFGTLAAETLRRAGRLGDARKQVDDALTRADAASATERADAHETATRIALEQKDGNAAARHAQLAHEADPSRPVPAFVRGRLASEEGRREDAVTAFAEAVDALTPGGPRLADLHQSYGDALLDLERHADAEAQFKLQIDTFPESPAAYISLATVYRATERSGEIEGLVTRLLDAVPTPAGYAAAARLWRVLGEADRANQVTTEALRRFPGGSTRALLERAARR